MPPLPPLTDPLRRHVEALARTPRPPSTAEHRQAADYVRDHLRLAGFAVDDVPFRATALAGVNLLTRPLPDRPWVGSGLCADPEVGTFMWGLPIGVSPVGPPLSRRLRRFRVASPARSVGLRGSGEGCPFGAHHPPPSRSQQSRRPHQTGLTGLSHAG